MIDPPSRAGDLQGDIDGFTTLARCVEQRAALDPLLGDAIDALKYDTFLRDACRVLEASKLREIRRCDAIDVSSLRDWCRATVAEVTSRADACPWIAEARPGLGRDPTCIAVAARDARFCAAVAETGTYERAACRAVAAHDEGACSPLRSPADEGRCRRQSERWRALVIASPSGATGGAPFPGSGKLHLEIPATSSNPSAVIDSDLARDPGVARGVIVSAMGPVLRFDVGTLAEDALEFVAPSPLTPVRFGVAVRVDAAAPGALAEPAAGARIERVSIRLPGRTPLETVLAQSSWKATSLRIAAARGAPVELRLSGTVSNAAETVHAWAEIHSFVRDVLRPEESAGARAGPEGTLK